MSIEIYVLSDRQLASIAEWQQAIDREGFALRLSTERPFDALSGHLPAQWDDKHAGFECDHWKGSEVIDENPDVEFGRRWEHVLAFRFGGDFGALLGAYAAAAAYARATDGVVFDGESGEVLTPEKAAVVATAILMVLTLIALPLVLAIGSSRAKQDIGGPAEAHAMD